MDKLKKVFSPGSKKDDEVLYGDQETRQKSAEKAPEREPEQLHPVAGSEKKEHGVLRQVLNPSGDKYDDQRFGTTATTQEPDPNLLQTNPEAEKKDHTIARQLINPAGDKYDEQRFGTTAQTGGDDQTATIPTQTPATVSPDAQLETKPSHKEHTILRQIINPHGEKYDQEAFGQNARASTSGPSGSSVAGDTALAGGLVGAGPSTTTTTTTTTSTVGPQSTQAYGAPQAIGDNSHVGRDGTIAGGLVAPGTDSNRGAVGEGSEMALAGGLVGAGTGATVSQARPGNTAQAYGAPQTIGETSHVPADGTIAGGLVAPGTSMNRSAVADSSEPGLAGGLVSGGTGAALGQERFGQTAQAYGAPQAIGDNSHVGSDGALAGGLVHSGQERSTAQHPQFGGSSGVAGGLVSAPEGYSQNTPGQSSQTYTAPQAVGETSHVRSQGAVAGGLVTGAAAGAGAGGSVMDRSHPLSGTGPQTSGTLGSSSTPSGNTSGGRINPIGEPEQSLQSGSHAQAIHDASMVGGAGGAGLAGSSATGQLNTAPDDVQAATYTARSYGLSSGTDGTPHIPGEFPLETGEDPHDVRSSGVRAGEAAGIAGGPGSTAGRNIDDSPIQPIGQPHDTAHLGRDAAIGAGAGGVAAYGLSQTMGSQQQSGATGPRSATSAGVPDAINQPTSANLAAAGYREDDPNYGPRAQVGSTAGPTSMATSAGTSDPLGPRSVTSAGVPDAINQPSSANLAAAGYREDDPSYGPRALAGSTAAPTAIATSAGMAYPPGPRSATSAGIPDATNQPTTANLAAAGYREDDPNYGPRAQVGSTTGAAGSGNTVLGPRSATSAGVPDAVNQPQMSSANMTAAGYREDDPNYGPRTVLGAGAGAATGAAIGSGMASSQNAPAGPRSAVTGGAPDASSQPGMTSAHVAATGYREDDPNYGPRAAVAGGAAAAGGAAGYGMYEASQRGDTGPASGTIGPHQSNVANVVDPRVQPVPSQMKEPTVGPHGTDMANRLDPRVTSEPSKAAQEGSLRSEPQYGRDAAIAGGAGVGAAGGYAALRDQDKPTTSMQPPPATSSNVVAPTYPPSAPARGTAIQDPQRAEESRRGRDAAAVAGGAGAVGAGAYAADELRGDDRDKRIQELEKQQKKAEKDREEAQRDQEKQMKKAEKDRVEAEKEREKQAKKEHKSREKEEEKEDEKEKKPSLIHRILHPGEGKEKEKPEPGEDNRTSVDEHGHNKLHKKSVEQPHHGTSDDRAIEPHTGLPMDTSKGTGAGGTDGAQQISGYHETDPAVRGASLGTGEGAGTRAGHPQPGQEGVAGPDWDAIKKSNTPY